ncbi:MAG: DUF5908 family protein [Methylococcaceae bacterium]|nr:DUF5908 family protein [Methylococcaceae bacterium]
MPIEIREIVIKASVVGSDHETIKPERLENALASLKKEILQECMEKLRERMDNLADR